MAWSKAAREAAAEARRRKARMKIKVAGVRGGTTAVSRDAYAKAIKAARSYHMSQGRHDPDARTRAYFQRRNAAARADGGMGAAQEARGNAKARAYMRRMGRA